jgi:hypothetical protein
MSYKVAIAKALSRLGMNGTINPDEKHNQGRLLGEAYLWDSVMAYAKAKSEAAWKVLEKEGILPDESTLSEGGEVEFGFSPSFVGTVKATQPVKRFSGEALAVLLAKSRWKVPTSASKEMINEAKVPTKPMVMYKIIERS